MKTIVGHDIRYFINRENRQIQIFCQSEKLKNPVPLISSRNSQREAERIKGNFILKDGFLAIVFGIASVPLIQDLIEEMQKNGGNILVFEYDPVLASYIYKEFFQEKSIGIITRNNMDSITDYIENFQMEAIFGYRILKVPGSISIHSDFYRQCEYSLKKAMASRFSDLFTRLEFESLWIKNSLMQIPFFSHSYPVRVLFQKKKISGSIGVIVSTGPSLRKALPILKKYRDKIFIACVDSAYRILSDYGIIPHLIITLDAQSFTQRHIKNLDCGKPEKGPILYADFAANPQVTRCWKGPLFFGVTAQYNDHYRTVTPGSDYIEKELLKNGVGDIQSGGSVSTSLFDLLRQMNFENIVLTGSDFAYSNREIHSPGTHHVYEWISKNLNRFNSLESINNSILYKREYSMQMGNSNKKIPADYVLGLYAHWFEEAAAKVDIHLYNASFDGLPLKNIDSISISHFEKILKTSLFDSESYVKDIFQQMKNLETLLPGKSHSQEFLEGLLKKFENFSKNHQDISKHNLSFLQYIGRKYEIQAKRKNDSSLLKKQKEEQGKFIVKLKKYFQGITKEFSLQKKLATILKSKNISDPFSIDFDLDLFPLNIRKKFAQYSGYILEIGSGWGEFTLQTAQKHPDFFIIALEMKKKRILHSIQRQKELGISNIRWMILNVNWFFSEIFQIGSFDKIIINFPDPWPKKKHHKHRFMGKDFIQILYQLLSDRGELEFATDHWHYMESVLKMFKEEDKFWENKNGNMVVKTKIENRPKSFFEYTMEEEGKTSYFLEMRKRSFG